MVAPMQAHRSATNQRKPVAPPSRLSKRMRKKDAEWRLFAMTVGRKKMYAASRTSATKKTTPNTSTRGSSIAARPDVAGRRILNNLFQGVDYCPDKYLLDAA